MSAVLEWPTPTNVHEVRNFHEFASFYRRFIHNFSGIMVPITECTKARPFSWTRAVDKAFQLVKKRLTEDLILKLLNFKLPFEVACDASHVGIGGVLSQ